MAHRMSIRPVTTESNLRVYPDSFKTRLIQLADETVESLQAIWKEAGYEESECQGLLGDLLHKIKVTCASELASEQQILEHAKLDTVSKLEQLNDYAQKLGRPARFEQAFGANYADKLANLESELSIIEIEVSERQSLLDIEYANIASFLTALGDETPSIESFQGPAGAPALSDARLKVLREYYTSIAPLKMKRMEEMKSIVNECKDYMNDMEIVKEGWDTLEDDRSLTKCNAALIEFVKTGQFNMGIHVSDLEVLKIRCASLLEEKIRRRDELSRTGTEIARLWTLLRIPSAEREVFQSSFQMNLSMATLAKGHDELDRLFKIRATSLKKVISSIRADILALWEEASIENELQRQGEFPMYFEDVETLEDSSVDVHEEYYSALKARVEELRPILTKIARREIIVNERIELEHIQMNPERLIARGPNAREERKREEGMNMRVKILEKLTKEVLGLIQIWEESRGPFIYFGERYFDRVAMQDDTYMEIRDSLRNSRKKGKETISKPEPVPSRTIQKKILAPSYGASMQSNLGSKLSALSIESLPVDENENDRNSTGSNGTECTSATEIRDRQSSATVVRHYNM